MIALLADFMFPIIYCHSHPGGSTWEEPKVQRGQICSWKVQLVYYLFGFILSFCYLDIKFVHRSSRGRIVGDMDISTEVFIDTHSEWLMRKMHGIYYLASSLQVAVLNKMEVGKQAPLLCVCVQCIIVEGNFNTLLWFWWTITATL